MDSLDCPKRKKIARFLNEPGGLDFSRHLLSCDKCFAFYLSIAAEESQELAPPDLAPDVMQKVRAYEKIRKKKKRSYLLRYTAAAASAIFLWSGGVFSLLAEAGEKSLSEPYDYGIFFSDERGEDPERKSIFEGDPNAPGIFEIINQKLFWRDHE